MAIKVIIMDVDGTLTNSKKQITPKTKEMLIAAQNKGIKLVLASGRLVSGLIGLAKELEMEKHHGLLVSFNGSKVVDCQTKEVLFNQTMRIEDAREVLEHMKNFKVYPMIDKGNYLFVNDVYKGMITYQNEKIDIIQYEARGGNFKLCEIEDLSSFVDFPLNKILTAGDPEYLNEHYQDMMEPFKERLNCMFTAPFYFEFTAKGIDKAKALDSVLKPMGFQQEEMVAFGDGDNDATMLSYAGIGVAMDNAQDSLKKIADKITLSNEEDGIAVMLETLL
ncbi:Cof-type HAD-IIB family hydrolase [Amedibacterium intestinale]|uniref:Cof-type HAD-IIB family hydrolase n=1 Tax=Amedibacterium intestinale TaxID=2583452 RepID=UPI0039968953